MIRLLDIRTNKSPITLSTTKKCLENMNTNHHSKDKKSIDNYIYLDDLAIHTYYKNY